ncbi:hypothetical protein C824_002290 [Schaedlerella arabinosiphila]|nr:hypothetical protein C824_002290 [Schaedlerella arabinosiphila]
MEYMQLLVRLKENRYQYHAYGNQLLNPYLIQTRILTGNFFTDSAN